MIGGHAFTTAETRFDFFAAPPIAGSDKLVVYGLCNGAALGFICWDLRLVIDQASSSTPILSQFSFTPNSLIQRAATSRSVTVSAVSVVPLPPAALLFLTGMAGLGLFRWRRRRRAAVAA